MNFKYLFGLVVSIPLLPILYFQGKRIKKEVPSLPAAKQPEGLTGSSTTSMPFKMLVVGESTMAGVGADLHENAFSGTLAVALASQYDLNISWVVYAQSGYTVEEINEELLPKIAKEETDLIVIGVGGNDAFQLSSPSKWRNQIKNLIEKLQNKYPKSPIVFINMPPIKEFPAFTKLIKWVIGNLVNILGEELSQVVKHYKNVYYSSKVVTYKGFIDRFSQGLEVKDFFSDGVHPSEMAYQLWARDVAEFIGTESLLKRPS